jgi:SAM-dependent methyltransferase
MEAQSNIAKRLGCCPICGGAEFVEHGAWLRDQLLCIDCGSLPRERALMLVLNSVAPDWRKLRIHESSPMPRGVSARLQLECPGYVVTHLFADVPFGSKKHGFRCEDLERQTFESNAFDLVITQDVMEHVFDPATAYREVWRTLELGGRYLHTVPILKHLTQTVRRAERLGDGTIKHLTEPAYHGDPLDPAGTLVTFDYGYDLPELIAGWASFDVELRRFHDRHHAILGEMTDVLICTKSCPNPQEDHQSPRVTAMPSDDLQRRAGLP